jgi:iron complex outermembrane receptor protein
LYYFREKGRHLQLQDIGLLPFGINVDSERLVVAKSISKAAYLQATWTPPVLDDRMKLTVGGRYTRDEREASRDLSVTGFPIDVGVANNQEFSNFSPAATLAMQWTPQTMTYAKMSKGYKAGGSAEGSPDFTATYGPEKVTSYEIGLKSQLFDRILTLNVAAFRNEFDDLQLDFVADPVDASVVATSNAGKATVAGFELEVVFQPVADLDFIASYTYLDPKLKSIRAPAGTNFDPALNPASPVQVGDDVTAYFVLPFLPENALSLSADWSFLQLRAKAFSAHVSYKYQEAFFAMAGAGPIVPGRDFYRNGSTRILDARLTLTNPLSNGKEVELSLYGKNLTDDRHKDFVIGTGTALDGYFSQAAPYSEPRTIGIEGRLAF